MGLPQILGTYDPTMQDIVFKGVTITGYADGTMITASRNEPAWTFKPSNSGGGARCRNPNKSGKFVFTLHQASPSNGVLSAFAALDEESAEGVGDVLVKDRSTGNDAAKATAQNGWVVQQATYQRSKETDDITWTIETDEILITHAGLLAQT